MTTATTIAVGALSILVSVALGWPLTRSVMRLASRSSDAGDRTTERNGITSSDGPDGARARASLRGGARIGILERAAITASVLTGFPTAIAFVIAVKGLPAARLSDAATFVSSKAALFAPVVASTAMNRWPPATDSRYQKRVGETHVGAPATFSALPKYFACSASARS